MYKGLQQWQLKSLCGSVGNIDFTSSLGPNFYPFFSSSFFPFISHLTFAATSSQDACKARREITLNIIWACIKILNEVLGASYREVSKQA